jgi:hypothetical protein
MDSYQHGLFVSLLDLVEYKCRSADFQTKENRDLFVGNVFQLFFSLPASLRPCLMNVYQHLIRTGWDLSPCAVHWIHLMKDRSLPVDAYCTAVAFLAQLLWVFPDNLTPEDFSCLFHSFLQAFGKCLQDFPTPWKADAILEFTSHGFHCLARFFSQDLAVGVNFVQELDPVTFMACFHSGLSVLQMSIPEADLAITRKNVRIVKAFRKTIEFLVQKSTWRLVKDPTFKKNRI